jgi:hypothetical protein
MYWYRLQIKWDYKKKKYGKTENMGRFGNIYNKSP